MSLNELVKIVMKPLKVYLNISEHLRVNWTKYENENLNFINKRARLQSLKVNETEI